jgi:HSP20 family protein
MSLVLEGPWSAVNRFHAQLNRLMQQSPQRTREEVGDAASWVPAVDISEESDRFVLVADVPGVALESIDITMDRDVIILKGLRKNTDAIASTEVLRRERKGGHFLRRFALPDGIDADQIEARIADGVLEISIPKARKAKPRRIEIRH